MFYFAKKKGGGETLNHKRKIKESEIYIEKYPYFWDFEVVYISVSCVSLYLFCIFEEFNRKKKD